MDQSYISAMYSSSRCTVPSLNLEGASPLEAKLSEAMGENESSNCAVAQSVHFVSVRQHLPPKWSDWKRWPNISLRADRM